MGGENAGGRRVEKKIKVPVLKGVGGRFGEREDHAGEKKGLQVSWKILGKKGGQEGVFKRSGEFPEGEVPEGKKV